MKINLYQRQHPVNLTHIIKASNYQHNPYTNTSSFSSVDFTSQITNICQVAVCEEPLFLLNRSQYSQEPQKTTKIRLKIEQGVLQYSEYGGDETQTTTLYDLNNENPHIQKCYDAQSDTQQIQFSSIDSQWILYSENGQIIDELYSFFKIFGIQSNFAENYVLGETLYDSPQFSLVSVKRKSDDTTFIAKSFYLEPEADCSKTLGILLKDIRTNRMIDHNKYSKLKEIFETKTHAYLIYDCEYNTTLENHVNKNGPLSENDTKAVMRRLIKALNYLHKRHKTSYRNLRPSVIMFCPSNCDIQLIDLGFTVDHTRTTDNKKIPPPGYLAPEILKCKKETLSADIFSIGAVMYFCLTGRPPFIGNDVIEINTNNKRCLIKYPKKWLELSEESRDIIKKMLNPHAYLRPDLQDIETHNWLFDISQIEGTELLGETRTINYKYLQIFKSKKAFQRAQADEEDCKRGDSHTILELLKPTINDGTLKNPFSKPPSRKVDHFIKSITIGAMAASKRKDSETHPEEDVPDDNGCLQHKMSRLTTMFRQPWKSPFRKYASSCKVLPSKSDSDSGTTVKILAKKKAKKKGKRKPRSQTNTRKNSNETATNLRPITSKTTDIEPFTPTFKEKNSP